MKRALIVLLVLLLLILIFVFWRRQQPQSGPVAANTPSGDCMANAEAKVAEWKKANKSDREIERLYQAEAARCSGVSGACASFVAAVNVDYAWLGRQVLSGSLAPADYLARVRDRSAKLRTIRRQPEICDAFGRGDADGDLVPDESDKCPNTANLGPTGPDGCDSKAPLPTAPSAKEVSDAAKALKVPVAPACRNAPVPGGSSVLRVGVNPADADFFLMEVTAIAGQPDGCPMFYEIEARLTNSSFFSGGASQDIIRRVYRAADAVKIPDPANHTLVFQLRRTDAIPWDSLMRTAIEPNDHAQKHIRVRAVNGNGSSAGWSSVRLREFRLNSRSFQ